MSSHWQLGYSEGGVPREEEERDEVREIKLSLSMAKLPDTFSFQPVNFRFSPSVRENTDALVTFLIYL